MHLKIKAKLIIDNSDSKNQSIRRTASFIFRNQVIPCHLGKNGRTIIKREGDGKTPLARLKPLWGYYRPDRVKRPQSPLSFHPLRPDMLWCDDPLSGVYNRLIKEARLEQNVSHERLWRQDHAYDHIVVLDWNMGLTLNQPARSRHRGSAIFLHQCHNDRSGTEGCIALNQTHLTQLLRFLSKDSEIEI